MIRAYFHFPRASLAAACMHKSILFAIASRSMLIQNVPRTTSHATKPNSKLICRFSRYDATFSICRNSLDVSWFSRYIVVCVGLARLGIRSVLAHKTCQCCGRPATAARGSDGNVIDFPLNFSQEISLSLCSFFRSRRRCMESMH